MSFFGPKLEPGEKVVLRRPAPFTWRQSVFGLAVAAAVVATTLAISLWLGSPSGAFFAVMIVVFLELRILFELWGWRRVMLAITDRRLLVKQAGFWWSPREVRLDEIENIRMNVAVYFIVVRGGGQEIEIAPELIELAELERVIERAKAGAL